MSWITSTQSHVTGPEFSSTEVGLCLSTLSVSCRMFFFYFESRGDKSTDPLVIWMTGGPGCSSEVALFFENGPYIINNDNKTLRWNDYGWDMVRA